MHRIVTLMASFFVEQPKVEEETISDGIKTLEIWHTGTVRHRVAAYLAHLESGKGNIVIQKIWKTYLKVVPDYYRSTHREDGRPDLLPLWMEQLIKFSQNKTARRSILLSLLFVFLVLSSHLWLPFIGFLPYETPHDQIHHLVNLSVQSCSESDNNATYCYLYNHEQLTSEALRMITESELLLFTSSIIRLNETLDLLVNEYKSFYYPIIVQVSKNKAYKYTTEFIPVGALEEFLFGDWLVSETEDDKESVALRVYLRPNEDILPILTHLHKQETALNSAVTSSPCICPLFLNIVANVSFLFEASEQRWLVMAQPVIHRNNSFAELVASSVSYSEKSLFHKRHSQWHDYVGRADLIHYDSFVIEYTEPSNDLIDTLSIPPEMTSQLSALNEKLYASEFTKASLLYRANEAEIQAQRKKVHVSGSDAICFIYCDTMQHKFFKKG